MEQEVSTEYMQGYVDAADAMHEIINLAIKNSNNNMLKAINDIIVGMHIQRGEMNLLIDYVDAKTSDEWLELFHDDEEYEEQMSIEDWIKKVFGDGKEFIIIKGGK